MNDILDNPSEEPAILNFDTSIMDIDQKVGHARDLFALANRFKDMGLGSQGTGFAGKRDLYDSCGWIRCPDFDDFLTWSSRGIGKIVNDIKPKATWNGEVRLVVPDMDEDSDKTPDDEVHPLTLAWAKLSKKHRITEKFLRADKAAGIGNYAIIFMGFDDEGAEEPTEPVKGDSVELLSLKIFKQNNCPVKSINVDTASEEFGQVKKYSLGNVIDSENRNIESGTSPVDGSITRIIDFTNKDGDTMSSTDITIDSSRVVHIAEDLLEDDIYGTPRLLAVLNYLQDYEKVIGGSGEMYFRGAFPGWIFAIDDDSDYKENDDDQRKKFENEVDQMIYSLKRYVRMQGITPHSLAPQVSDPTAHAKVQIDAISATTETPNRKLMGSERAEMASSQDEHNWNGVIDGRRRTDCERWVRDMVDKLMSYGTLPKAEEYIVEFPELSKQDGEKMSKIAMNYATAFRSFKMTPGLDQEITFEDFLINFAKIPEDLARKIVATADAIEDEDADLIEDEETDELPGGGV